MIDTIGAVFELTQPPKSVELKPTDKVPYPRELSDRYWAQSSDLEDVNTPIRRSVRDDEWDLGIKYQPKPSKGFPWMRVRINVSLPKVLFRGDNSKLIWQQAEIDKALRRVKLCLKQKGFSIGKGPFLERLDLVWHFEAEPVHTFLGHFATNHQDLALTEAVDLHRKFGRITGVTWKGSELTINAYDKVAKGEVSANGRHQPLPGLAVRYVRLEFQLTENKLKSVFTVPKGARMKMPKITTCYEVYRSLALKFEKPNPKLMLLPPSGRRPVLIDFAAKLPVKGPPRPSNRWIGPQTKKSVGLLVPKLV